MALLLAAGWLQQQTVCIKGTVCSTGKVCIAGMARLLKCIQLVDVLVLHLEAQPALTRHQSPAANRFAVTWHLLQLHGGHSGIEGPGLSQQQKLGYAFAFVAMPYFWVRLHRYAVQRDWGQDPSDRWSSLTWRALRGADAAHKLGMVLNSWVFLYQGKYRYVVVCCRRLITLSGYKRIA